MNALSRLASLLLLFVACSPAFSQDDRCDLQLRVLSPDLRPLDGIKGKAVWRGNTIARRPLHVIYQTCHAQYYFIGCFVLVRVVDEQGKKIEGAVATIMPGMKRLKTDRFGRFRVQLARKLEYEVSVVKEDIAGARSIPCTLDRDTFTEETIVLKLGRNRAEQPNR